MLRDFIFKEADGAGMLTLPVTPANFSVARGVNFEVVNVHTLGDVAIAGYPTLATVKIECLLPAHAYAFVRSDADLNPYAYTAQLEKWSLGRTLLRWIVAGTPVNLPVKIESVEYGERDGTNDVYAAITLREQRTVEAVKTQAADASENKSRTDPADRTDAQSYTIKAGDTLSAICRQYYGDASLYGKLAVYNDIKNPHLIYAGNTLKIPPKSKLGG